MNETESLQTPDAAAEPRELAAQLATLARTLIVPSRTNPRTHFDPAYIKELRASIQDHGIIQPILVRPLPGARTLDTFLDREPGTPLPTHEIVCGECRWRASDDAAQIPVLIRSLTDVQVLQIQLVENLRRKDLHPLEEAEGFDRLIKDHGMTVEEIAAKVGKSVSQIYVTLKLLDLTPECREELYAGTLTRSTALLVARAPAYLQTEIAKDIMHAGFDEEPMSYRAAVRHIQQHYMLQLSTAVFDIQDAQLVAKAGDCQACPKRTGANSDLFEDVKQADTCTDPKCFDAKKVAHFAQVAKAAEAKGQKVIQGKEAKELMPYEGATPTGYKLLDSKDYINGHYTSLRKEIGKGNVPTPVVIIDPHTKQAVEALPVDVANKLLKKATGAKTAAAKDKPLSEQELKWQFDEAWKTKAVRQIFGEIMTGKGQSFGIDVARELALYLAHDLGNEEAELVTELLGIGKVAKGDGIEAFIRECPAEKVAPALLLCSMLGELDRWSHETPFINVLAKDTGVDLTTVQAEVKADMKAAAAQRKEEAEAKTQPAKAAAKKPAGKKKVDASEAQAGIAKALQDEPASANDFAVGDRVRFTRDVKPPFGKKVMKLAGKEGTIQYAIGERCWTVRRDKGDTATVDYSELELVERPTAGADKPVETAAWPFPTAAKADKKAKAKKAAPAIVPPDAPAGPFNPVKAWPFPTTTQP